MEDSSLKLRLLCFLGWGWGSGSHGQPRSWPPVLDPSVISVTIVTRGPRQPFLTHRALACGVAPWEGRVAPGH